MWLVPETVYWCCLGCTLLKNGGNTVPVLSETGVMKQAAAEQCALGLALSWCGELRVEQLAQSAWAWLWIPPSILSL